MGYSEQSTDRISSTAPMRILKLGLVGVVINLVGARIVSFLDLPIFLDSVGTVLVAVLGGYLPGITTGLLTNLLKDIQDSTAIYYGALNVLIAVVSAYFAKHKYLKNPSGAIPLILILSAIGGVLGFFITWILYGQAYELTLAHSFVRAGIPYFEASFAADYLADLCDKTFTVIIVFFIIRFLPSKIKERSHLEGWHQNPLSEDVKRQLGKIKCRVSSMRTRILMLLILASILIAMAITGISAILYHNAALREYRQLGEGTASIAARVINVDEIGYYLEEGPKRRSYLHTRDLLYGILDSTEDIIYIDICKYLPDGCHIIYDLEEGRTEGLPAGSIRPYNESFKEYVPDLLAGKPIDPILKNDENGLLMCVYQPVYDSIGRCVCYAEVYLSMNRLKSEQLQFLARMIALCFGFLVMIFAAGAWLAEYDIVYPVNSMAYVADSFEYDTARERVENVEKIRQLNISTGDEIENLYLAFCKTMVLADMVESRDHNTGQHVRKTAAYVRIIMDQMLEEGIYTEELTDSFMNNVCRSAPLHDIGKINIPDAILNKPGRLTQEEFEIMKTHTTAGRDILVSAIDNVPDAGYLWEARALAAHHHERWDGKGYPDGLSGEDIPLSARIMAVADVFDALVSKRSYKEGFPFEKAIEIIKEGIGTQFDPKVAMAFIHAEEKVREVSIKLGDGE